MDTVLILWITVIIEGIIILIVWSECYATKNLLGGGKDRIYNLNYMMGENKRLEALRKRYYWVDNDD